MQKGEFRISWLSTQPTIFLLLLIFLAPVHADVTVDALTQDLPATIIDGENPTYTLTVSNPDTQTATISVSILDNGVDSTALFVSLSRVCTIVAGEFSCGSLASGATQSYQFTWINPPAVGDHLLTFDVGCQFDGVCVGGTAQITTTVIAESVSVTDITGTAAPGDIVTQTISVIHSLPTTITTDPNVDSFVSPTTLPAGGGDFVYSLTIPTTAIANEVITDTITINDGTENVTTIPVSVTVIADTVSVTEIKLDAVPGETATQTFTVSNALPTTNIATDPNVDSSVNPTSLPAGGGDVVYSITIPATAVADQVITDTITITDDAGNVTTIPVSVTVTADTVSVTEITLNAVPGETATATFTVAFGLPTNITTANVSSSVNPTSLPVGGGDVVYSITIPDAAIANEVITDIITITDDTGNPIATISVSVTVTSDTVSVTEITLTAAPGGTATDTFTVANALPTIIATDPNVSSLVTPTELPAGGGDVEYSITIPDAAIANEVIQDIITISDDAGNVIATIPVSVTVMADTVSVTEITLTAAPGEIAKETFTVSFGLPTNITTDPNVSGSVTPTLLPAGGGDVVYSITIPDAAIANEVISDKITISDDAGNPITTITVSVTVIEESVSVTEITLFAAPGETVPPQTFTVINRLPTTITTDPDIESSVDPETLPAGGGDVEYSLTVPLTAAANQVITDTITITDEANKVTTISVSVTVSSFAGLPGLTSSEREVAIALDSACTALTGSEALTEGQANLLAICNELDSAAISTQVLAIKQMTPKQAPAQGTASVEISQRQFDNITARMTALRSGATGISASGLNMEYRGLSLPATVFSSASGTSNGGSAGEGNSSLFGKLGIFINGSLSFGDKDSSSDELGFDFNTRGLTAGLDYRFTDQFVVGGALGYVSNSTDFNDSRGDMDVDGYTLSVYSTYYHSENTYLDAIASYGWNDFDNSREIGFGTVIAETSGSTDGEEFSISLGGGYDFNRNGLSFGPSARVNYINADIDSYTEESLTGLELNYDDQNVESLSTLLGGQLSYAISTSSGVFIPQLRFEWAHEFENDGRFIHARFVHDPTKTSFRLSTDDPDRDYFNLGAGVSATFGAGKSGYIYYESLLGHEDIKQHSLAAGIRIEF